jgi:hypothetical protein
MSSNLAVKDRYKLSSRTLNNEGTHEFCEIETIELKEIWLNALRNFNASRIKLKRSKNKLINLNFFGVA